MKTNGVLRFFLGMGVFFFLCSLPGLLSNAYGVTARIEDVTARPGSTVTVKVFIDGTDRQVDSTGLTDIQGWTLSGRILGSSGYGLNVSAVRIAPSISPWFQVSEPAIDPSGPDKGFVSGVVLSETGPNSFPVGEQEVAEFDVTIPSDIADGTVIQVVLIDGMQGSGQPFENIFVAGGMSNYFQSFTTGKITIAPPPGAGGSVTGMSVNQVTCQNQTTGRKVKIRDGATSWNCEQSGLLVHAGDKIKMEILGVAN